MLATNAARLLLSSAAVASMAACASPRSPVPEGAHVETLQTQSLVLRGTAPPHPGSASCGSVAPSSTAHLLELKEDATGNVELRPMRGVAVLHVTLLGTTKTWCAMTKGDGAGATIPGDFATGVYAISVESSRSGEPVPYQVVFEKL